MEENFVGKNLGEFGELQAIHEVFSFVSIAKPITSVCPSVLVRLLSLPAA